MQIFIAVKLGINWITFIATARELLNKTSHFSLTPHTRVIPLLTH